MNSFNKNSLATFVILFLLHSILVLLVKIKVLWKLLSVKDTKENLNWDKNSFQCFRIWYLMFMVFCPVCAFMVYGWNGCYDFLSLSPGSLKKRVSLCGEKPLPFRLFEHPRGYRLKVNSLPSKQMIWVRFSLPAWYYAFRSPRTFKKILK